MQRLKNLLLDRGLRYDSVDAVLALNPDDITDSAAKAGLSTLSGPTSASPTSSSRGTAPGTWAERRKPTK